MPCPIQRPTSLAPPHNQQTVGDPTLHHFKNIKKRFMILVYKLVKILVIHTDIHIVIFKSAKLLLTTKKNLFYRLILMLFLNNIKLIFSFKKSV